MKKRITVAAALLIMASQAYAAKAAKDDTEYLLPENWEAGKASAEPSGLPLTAKTFNAGMKKHLKEVPQCAAATLSAPNVLNDGKEVHQQLKLQGAEVDVLLSINAVGKIANAKFLGAQGAKDENQMNLMSCSTFAVMRTLQPEYESVPAALKNMRHSWVSAQSKPFEKSFYFNKIKTQLVPLEMNVY